MKFPNQKEIKKVLKDIKEEDYSLVLDHDASNIDKTKYELCKKFVLYLKKHQITQRELANKLNTDVSRVNWIVKYRINYFTIDKLYEHWLKIEPTFTLRVG